MKILAVRGECIASLARPFEVDFDSGPIAQAGIFAITGPTGSGKSSLLDAMCLALFAKTPRVSGSGKEKGGVPVGLANMDDKERVRTTDPRGLLSKGEASGYAEVDFVGIDAQRYRARWTVRRARGRASGNLQKFAVSLHAVADGRDLSSNRSSETLERIEAKLGLDFDQFRRSVLLAQGQFAEFLRAGGSARAALLERMTGTEVYARISRKAHERAKAEADALRSARDELRGLEVLEPPARAELDATLAAAEGESRQLEAQHKTLQAQLEWHERHERLCEGLAQVDARVGALFGEFAAHAEAQWSSPWPVLDETGEAAGVEEIEGVLEGFVRAQRQVLEAGRAAQNALDAAELDAQRVGKELAALESAVQSERAAHEARGREREQLEAEARAHRSWLESHAHLEGRVVAWSLIEVQARRLADCDAQQKARAEQLAGLSRSAPQLEHAAKVAEGALAQAKAHAERSEAAALELEAQVAGVDRARLQARRDALGERATLASRLLEDLAGWVELRARAAQIAQRAASAQAKEAEASEQMPLVRAKLEQARDTLHRTRETLTLAARREELLVDERACPLCGSTEHPYASQAPVVHELVREQEEALAALQSQFEALREQHSQARAELEAERSSAVEVEGRVASARGQLETRARDWPDDEGVDALGLVGLDGLDEASEREQTVAGIESRIASHRDAWMAERTQLDAELAAHLEAFEAAQAARKAANQASREQVQAGEKATQAAIDVKDNQRAQAESRRELERLAGELTAAGEQLQTHFEGESWREALVEDLDAWLERVGAGVHDYTQRREQARELDKRLPALVASLEASAKQLAARAGELEKKTNEQRAVRERGERCRRARAEFFRGAALATVEELLQALGQAAAVRSERARSVEAHRARGRPERGVEQARAALEAQAQARAQLDARLEPLRAQRSVDDEHRRRRKRLGTAIAAREAEASRWENLSSLIGSADGKKFRDFAQGLTLQIVLAHANEQLRELRPRYELMTVPGYNLEMQVIDHEMGDEIRPITSLSGGETFLVSLALALGLAESTGSATAVESLFIDEGFGTLDGDTLELAISTLDALQDRGRTIGLISHVDGLAGRLGAQVKVTPQGGGRSRVSVVGALG